MRTVALGVLLVLVGCDRSEEAPVCLYDSPLGAFLATFGPDERCERALYATGLGTMKQGLGNSCGDPTVPVCTDPHPVGWCNIIVGEGGAHARTAPASIPSCAECHDGAGANCMACHARGPRVNPHRGNWGSFSDFPSVTNEACLVCHF